MSLSVPENLREPWSPITDTRILHPGDELRLIGVGFVAIIGVLDSHDPYRDDGQRPLHGKAREEALRLGLSPDVPPEHHHILIKLEQYKEVFSSGLKVGTGTPNELLIKHVSSNQLDAGYIDRVFALLDFLKSGNHGLFFMSDAEPLSSLPEGRVYLDEQGGLLAK